LEQTDFLVESLQAGFDDLVDDVGRLALLPEFFGEHIFLARNRRRREAGGIHRLWIGRSDMHRYHAAEPRKLVSLSRRFQTDEDTDLAETVADGIVHVGADRTFADRQRRRATQRHVLADLGD